MGCLRALGVFITCLLPVSLLAHPGSGIVVDRSGQIYFVDMVSGVWKIDARGALTPMAGPSFHWMTLDDDDRFKSTALPSGSGGDIARIGASPTLLLGSDTPLAMGPDGNLYYPSHGAPGPLKIMRLAPSGRTSAVATLPAASSTGPLRDVNGLAVGADGALYYSEDDAIRRIGEDGRVSTVAEHIAPKVCPSTPDRETGHGPLLRGLDVDAAGTIYVAATSCGSVLKVTPAGATTVLVQVDSPWSPTGVKIVGADVYVLEFLHAASDVRREMVPRVRKVTANGQSVVVATVAR